MKSLLLTVLFWPLLLGGCGADVFRADKPLTLEEVRRRAELDFPLPASAHHIYYGWFSEFQPFEMLVRFDLPPAECPAAVEAILRWHRQGFWSTSRQPLEVPAREETAMVLPASGYLHPVPWFDGQRIAPGGLRVGEADGGTREPALWVDLSVGRIYYRTTD